MIIAFICIVLIFNTMETISIHRPKIVVIGSCNTDMVVKANRLPVPGETILGGTFYMNPGGKGANQAIAAARLGAEVTFISKIGYDFQQIFKILCILFVDFLSIDCNIHLLQIKVINQRIITHL